MSDVDMNFLRPDKAPGMGIAFLEDLAPAAPGTGAAGESASILRPDRAQGMDAGFEEDGATGVTVYLHLLIITSGSVYGDSGGASGGLAK